jgi:acetyltransferase-like isoleucine patch superfamily enzyme
MLQREIDDMFRRLISSLFRLLAVRRNVTVGGGFHVGPGSVLWAPRALVIGKDVYIGKNVTVEVDGEIGDGVLIANLVGIVGRTDHDQNQVGTSIRRSSWVGEYPDRLSRTTLIGSDVWLGYGAIILSGISIGDSSVVAAGSVVTKDIPANSVVVGNPGRVISQRFTDSEYQSHWASLNRQGLRALVPDRAIPA